MSEKFEQFLTGRYLNEYSLPLRWCSRIPSPERSEVASRFFSRFSFRSEKDSRRSSADSTVNYVIHQLSLGFSFSFFFFFFF